MSADNGVYILSTPMPNGEREYRVREMGAIDNLSWDGAGSTDDPRVLIENARRMWKNAPAFNDIGEAFKEADKIYKELPICEYGISTIEMEIPFSKNTPLEAVGGVLLTEKDIHSLLIAEDACITVRQYEAAASMRDIVAAAKKEREEYDEIRSALGGLN